ncbi:MAG TPA: hypothetical protein VLC48_05270, partial [Gemmatimonadota bacterium]|nr:hypothetical protein [Gemmatimonadota bacterium]
VAQMVRAFFEFFAENPEFPRLILHELARSRPMPDAMRGALERRVGLLGSLIRQGQADGSIREGEPLLLALSVASQPLWMALAAAPLREGARIDVADPGTRARLVESVVEFVQAGLAAAPER